MRLQPVFLLVAFIGVTNFCHAEAPSAELPALPVSSVMYAPSSAAASTGTPAEAQAETQAEIPTSTLASTTDTKIAPDAEEEIVVAKSNLRRFQIGVAKGDWLALLTQHIPELSSDTDSQNVTPTLIRKLRQDIGNILATEGYFSPVITFDAGKDGQNGGSLFRGGIGNLSSNLSSNVIRVNIDAGSRTTIQQVDLQFSGALEDAAKQGKVDAVKRRQALIADWRLPVGSVFRDEEWDKAKTDITESLRSDVYASASIINSNATIDADSQSGSLKVEIDSGPPFTLGDPVITGLQRYPPWLLDRYLPPKKGEPYSRSRLLEYQRALQNSAYFSAVAVSVDPDPSKADRVPVDVSVVERRPRDLAFGVGYSSNTGFRTEVSYRDRDLLDRAWDLRSAVRLEQRRQLAYADIYLPPRDNQFLDSFGVLLDKSNLAGLDQTRTAIGVKRTSTRGHLEQRLGLNLSREKVALDGEPQSVSKALVSSVGWTWRDVDDSFAPRKGQILQLDFAISEKALISDQRFIRTYAKYQQWIPVAKRDVLLLRAEIGQVLAPSIDGIPEDYLFRTGGSSTVRGYSYQSLGIQHPTGVTGGMVMGVASAEYVHWTQANWGAAAFIDAGDAADDWNTYKVKQGFGVGGRYKTPAGPIALDLAYGKNIKKFRLDFSIAVAF
ncbi:translocation and assembly module TamA [Undibacterium sp. GrIS 1.2]|uniref:autotransporter assembly complex protein TamA n=2 Tax=unclassified Undibacterium TaxID=2630295 RepID=UPI0033991595